MRCGQCDFFSLFHGKQSSSAISSEEKHCEQTSATMSTHQLGQHSCRLRERHKLSAVTPPSPPQKIRLLCPMPRTSQQQSQMKTPGNRLPYIPY